MITWPIVKLEEVAEVTSSKRIYASEYVDSGVPFYRSKEVIELFGGNSISLELFIEERKFAEIEQQYGIPVEGDILLSAVGTLGVPYRVQENDRFYFKDGNLIWFRKLKGINSKYLYLWLVSASGQASLSQTTIGVAQPAYTIANLKRVRIPLPPMEEQEKIADAISAYDELIQTNRLRVRLLEQQITEVYREWFCRFRFPEFKATTFEKGLPKDWDRLPLKVIAEEVRDSVKKEDLDDGDLYVGLEHIPRRSFSFKEHAYAVSVGSNKLRFQERDILFAKIRPYLHKVALAHWAGACSTDTIVVRPKEAVFEGFLLLTMFSDTFVDLATVSAKGTKMPRADWSFLERQKICIPPTDILSRFQSYFDSSFSQIVTLLESNDRLRKCRDMLLNRLMSGVLSLNNVDIKSIQIPEKQEVETSALELVHA